MSKKLGGGLEEISPQQSSSSGHSPIQTSLQGIQEPTTILCDQPSQPANAASATTEYPHSHRATGTNPSQSTSITTPGINQKNLTKQPPTSDSARRQVIAVSASKGPAAFFNLARKFLATDEVCDLSALEGAIVSAVDAAHLLERSQLATIVRVQTSYVVVEPKRKSQQQVTNVNQSMNVPSTSSTFSQAVVTSQPKTSARGQSGKKSQGRSKSTPLRRARILITVKRTEAYSQWLEENPNHLSGDEDIDVGGRAGPVEMSENSGSKPPSDSIT